MNVGATSDAELPSFLVIGAQKSASTFLQDQLSLHPEVEIPEGEVRLFEDPFYTDDVVASLIRLYQRPAGEAVRGLKRPGYLGRAEVPARLYRHVPDAEFFVVLREPIARAVSSYFHMARHGFVPVAPIDQAFRALLDGDWETRYPRSVDVLRFGLYGEHLRTYLVYFPADRFMVFDSAPLTSDARGSLARAFEFIGVDPGFQLPPRENKVSNKGVYAPWRLKLLRTKNRTQYSYASSLGWRDPKEVTPWGWLYNAAAVGVDRTILSRFDDGRPPELSPRMRAELEEYYAEDRALLKELIVQWPVELEWLS